MMIVCAISLNWLRNVDRSQRRDCFANLTLRYPPVRKYSQQVFQVTRQCITKLYSCDRLKIIDLNGFIVLKKNSPTKRFFESKPFGIKTLPSWVVAQTPKGRKSFWWCAKINLKFNNETDHFLLQYPPETLYFECQLSFW